MPKEGIRLNMKEANRLPVLESVIKGMMKQREAAEKLQISDRQVRNLIKKVKKDGVTGLAHKLRGRTSNRSYPGHYKKDVLEIYDQNYSDFGPTFASEKLMERHNIKIHSETLRLWLMQEGKWQRKRKRRRHRKWRERKKRYGEMVQFDGSHHDWFEGRCELEKQVLLAFIDDATSEVYAQFYEYEGTLPTMDILRLYFKRYGAMQSIYLDRHTTYKSPSKGATLSQVQRAAKELGIEIIHAQSPQAKGRVERLFGTLQDRLVKELRLSKISDLKSANSFLVETFLPAFNNRFSKKNFKIVNLHRKMPLRIADKSLCIKDYRKVHNDNTIQYENQLCQLESNLYRLPVEIRIRADRKLRIYYKDKPVKYKLIKKAQKRKSPARYHQSRILPMPVLMSDHRRVYG